MALFSRYFPKALAIFLLLFACGCELEVEGNFGQGVDYGANNQILCVAMGDSITAAYGLSDPGQGYVARLAALLNRPIVNEGIGGARSDNGSGRVGSVLSRYKPGVLIILYGANDVYHYYSADATIGNLRAMIRAAKANNTIPVIATLTPVGGSYSGMAGRVRDRSEKIRTLAAEEHAALVDLYAAFDNNSGLLSDGLHPNSAGHELMALTFYEVMR